jgi:DNA repair protein RecO (recombination protein O)
VAAAAINWATALTAATLPEDHPYPDLYAALSALLDAICLAPSARGWAEALVRYELLLLDRLGFGLDLDRCVVTGAADDLAYVSPKSACAVCRSAAAGYEARLLPLPAFLHARAATPDWSALIDGLALTGHFLERHFFAERRRDIMAARRDLIDRLKRAVA